MGHRKMIKEMSATTGRKGGYLKVTAVTMLPTVTPAIVRRTAVAAARVVAVQAVAVAVLAAIAQAQAQAVTQ